MTTWLVLKRQRLVRPHKFEKGDVLTMDAVFVSQHARAANAMASAKSRNDKDDHSDHLHFVLALDDHWFGDDQIDDCRDGATVESVVFDGGDDLRAR